MKREKWISEDEMYKIIDENKLLESLISEDGYTNFKILKQQRININYDRPDYLIFVNDENKKPTLYVVEVKITATLETLSQVQKYTSSLENYLLGEVDVLYLIIARYFDIKLKPFTEFEYTSNMFSILEKDEDGNWSLGIPEKTDGLLLTRDFKKEIDSYFNLNGRHDLYANYN